MISEFESTVLAGERTAPPLAARTKKVRLLVILRSFSAGGAERQMIELLKRIDKALFDVSVVCFYEGPWHEQARGIPGIEVRLARKRGRYDLLGFSARLLGLARELRPDLIYGYMFAADTLALVLAKLTGAKAVFGVRCSRLDLQQYDRLTHGLYWLSCRIARRAHLVIANSHAGLADYVASGARPRRSEVIPNGIDVERFAPDARARAATRLAWARSESDRIIGLVARIDPMKGHDVFLLAAAALLRSQPDVWFACVGSATPLNTGYASSLREQAQELGIAHRLLWIDGVEQVEAVFPALDIVTSASRFGEGFSNAVAEAMASGVPCVVTQVGDNGRIVEEPELIVPPGDSAAMCAAWERLLGQLGERLSQRVRSRIQERFSVERYVAATQTALLRIAVPA